MVTAGVTVLAEEESMNVTMIRAVHLESFSEQSPLLILQKDGRLIGLGRRRVIGSLTWKLLCTAEADASVPQSKLIAPRLLFILLPACHSNYLSLSFLSAILVIFFTVIYCREKRVFNVCFLKCCLCGFFWCTIHWAVVFMWDI